MDNDATPKKWYKKPIFYIPAGIIILWLILPESTKYSLMGLFGSFLSLVFWGACIWGVIWLIRWIKKGNENKRKEARRKARQAQIGFWQGLGDTVAEREKNIKTLFDAKSASLSFGDTYNFESWNGQANASSSIVFRISRNLSAMEAREREFLKTALLLYNSGKLDEGKFHYFMFSFINGNGKASIEDYNWHNSYEDFKNGPNVIKFYQDKVDGSVDSAINALLGKVEEMGQSGNNENLKHIKDIKRRIHGDGSWLDADETEGTVFNGHGSYQLSIGHLEDSETILHYSGEGSLITIAPPGSGKTQCFVIPNMLTWKGAAVVLDIKGEIHAATSGWREKNIGKIYKFSPLDPANSNSYNPLAFVRDEPDYIWEDSRFLADMMIVPSGASDPFWENMARDVLTAAIAYIAFNNEANERAMSKVLDIVYGIGWDEMITSLKTNVMVSSMRRIGNALDEMEKKQRDSILKTAQSSLSAWQGERIAKVTNKSDWSPLDLRNGTPTVYICINPNEIESYLSVIRVFIAQHIRMLTTELPQRGAAPVLFMLDELPRLKKMPPVDEALNIGRQYGIKLWMFAQSYGQLKDAYPDPEGLIGSCVVRTFMNLPLNDEYTAKISDQLGYRHDALGNTKEKLVEPIELAGPNYRDLILVMATGTKPARVRKKFAYEDAELRERMN